jgi:transglutaminase-like putative cysteine protease
MGHRTSQRLQSNIAATLTLLLLAFAGIPAHAAGPKNDPIPAWLTDAVNQTLPTYPAATRAVVLLDQTDYDVSPNGAAVEHRRHVVKILRPNGRDRGIVRLSFDEDTKIRSFKVWSIGPDGHTYALKDSDMVDRGYGNEGPLYVADKYREAVPPGRDPGGIVAYEYTQDVRPHVTETTWEFQGSIPRVSQTFTLTLPPGYTYGTVWAHHDTTPVIELEHQHFRWEMKDTPAVNLEDVPMAPAYGALAGRMTIHYAGAGLPLSTEGTWPSIGEWYARLEEGRLNPTPEIAAKSAELTAGKTDFYAKAEAIGEYVQNKVRYFVIEMGIGGYQPHPAGEIFRNHYGDCKDKATLVSAMLQSVGIHSALMMVDTERGVVDPDAPSLVGNHMIAAIEIPSGYQSPSLRSVVTAKNGKHYLIFDPTWELTPFGQLENNLQGSYGILLEGAQTEAIQLPVLAPDRNTIRRNATLELKPDGTLEGSVTEKRFGDASVDHRRYVEGGDSAEQRRMLDQLLNQDFSSFSVSDFKIDNVASLNKDYTMSYNLTADHYARTMGSLLMLRPRILGTNAIALDKKPRTVPIDLGETMQATDSYDIKLPPDYTIDELPLPVKLDLGFASYESASTFNAGTLHYTRTFTIRQITLPASNYTDLQHLASVINADEQNNAILARK